MKIKSKTKKMDQFLTYKKGSLGPVFNFTADIYAVGGESWPPQGGDLVLLRFLLQKQAF